MDLFAADDSRPVHFMGIGGAGMSALALLARRRGVQITGCDNDVSGAEDLIALGVPVVQGHAAGHEGSRAVVVTAAVPADHPELVAARAAQAYRWWRARTPGCRFVRAARRSR
jgi:UDP-N-acetylmuramate--alanine ligase